ncbi:MAG: ferric reductase-like transmembrane domain-containing protein [Candidatus Peribacteria bacterium]|nr:MAG: ferric reductase-like transmembrane domain-containing protein [Candidatus Peribacteria bacterium]
MAINVLWILLWLPILSKVFQLKLASTLMVFRRPLGVLMGTMALVHSGQYFMNEYVLLPWQQAFWIWDGQIAFTAWGFLGLIIAIILTITSNNISLKFFGGKLWKWIHRSVYVLLIFTLLHVLFLKLPGVQDSLPLMIAVFFPFVLYMIGKILEWKGVKLRKG